MTFLRELELQYKKIISDYITNKTERNLYIGQNFTRQLIRKNVLPEDVINMHKKAMEQLYPDIVKELHVASDFLIEVMVHYGLAHREHQSLAKKRVEMKIELDIAVKIQKTLLETEFPSLQTIDIGMVSIPFRTMNGDYVHFFQDTKDFLSVAVTDVVGKGVPAALCMSMVKYGLEMLEYVYQNPSHILEALNRVIEKSVDDSMFVSMFYGRYDSQTSIFSYASAGHEPALYYSAKEDRLNELEVQGLLLGVLPEVSYSHYELKLEVGDIVIMMTDGVTEFRTNGELNSREVITSLIEKHKHLTAQQLCTLLHKEIERLRNFKLTDDFTIVILKK